MSIQIWIIKFDTLASLSFFAIFDAHTHDFSI